MKRSLTPKAGVALPMVLLITTVTAFTLLAVVTSLDGLRRETATVRDSAEFQRAAMTAEARFMFLALTEPMGPDGLYVDAQRDESTGRFPGYVIPQLNTTGVVLSADGRLYRWLEADGDNDFRVAVQDEAGLLNLYQADADMLTRMFQQTGLNEDDAINLANELVAYNADPTAHQPMRRPAQLYRLEDAPTLLPNKTWKKLQDLVVSYPDSSAANINTASLDVLKAWFNLDDDTAQGIIDQRKTGDGLGNNNIYTSTDQIGVAATGGQTYVFPSGRLRFRFTDPRTGYSYQSSLVLTPADQERPVWVENARVRHDKPQPDPEDDIQDFPQIPSDTGQG